MGEIQCAAVLVSPLKEIRKGSHTTPSTGIVLKQHSCLEIVCLTRIFSYKLMSSESFLAKAFLGFPRTKDINENTHLESTHCMAAVTTYRTRPTTILNRLVSLTFPLHSSIGNLTLSLNVFLFPLFSFQSLQNALCNHGHENARTNLKKKEVLSVSPPEMPLVISCTFLGNGNTTSVPISVSFTQIRGPKERVATALY